MEYQNHITIDSRIRFGKPCIKGTRIAIYDILGWLASGMTIAEIVDDFPELTNADVLACLSYVSEKERKVRIAV
jgi:uncharacterized protein (DUF433 family)